MPCLWLTPASYQNDPDEGKSLYAFLKSEKSGIDKELKKIIEESKLGEEIDNSAIAFIRSFSECKDDLRMWDSSYAQNGVGIAIGVCYSKLSKADNKSAGGMLVPKKMFPTFSENGLANPVSSPKEFERLQRIPMGKIFFAKILYLPINAKDEEDLLCPSCPVIYQVGDYVIGDKQFPSMTFWYKV